MTLRSAPPLTECAPIGGRTCPMYGALREPVRGWEGRHHRANVKILRNLGVSKRVFGESGGARLPQAPPVVTLLQIYGVKLCRILQRIIVLILILLLSKLLGARAVKPVIANICGCPESHCGCSFEHLGCSSTHKAYKLTPMLASYLFKRQFLRSLSFTVGTTRICRAVAANDRKRQKHALLNFPTDQQEL